MDTLGFGILYGFVIVYSTLLYLYLNYKASVELKFLFIDNILVILFAIGIDHFLFTKLITSLPLLLALNFIGVPGLVILDTLIRFYRVPVRKTNANSEQIISPADGHVIYINRIESDQIPFSVKKHRVSKLEELTKTDILKTPCWLVGIEMTPFDVHKNCAPIEGKVVLNQHFNGKFLSLRLGQADIENERNTIVIDNGKIQVGFVQIASRKVRRILQYVKPGDFVKRGQWVGMITFGSQVDVIVPVSYNIDVKLGQQIYAGETLLASPVNE